MKIRTDFVTNSSSSSFVLVIRIGWKNGEVLKFIGDSGVGEGDETYYQLAALKSPEELGRSGSIEALIQMLKESIVEEDAESVVLTDDDPIIRGLKGVKAMDEIEFITINGDRTSRDGEDYQYWHYTYYRDKSTTAYDEGGEFYENEGDGGRIAFGVSGKKVKGTDFGEHGDEDGFDGDVGLPGEKQKKKKTSNLFTIRQGVLRKYRGNEEHVEIPEEVTVIDEYAFENSDMKSLVIPDGVSEIYPSAFDACFELESISLPSSIESIGEDCFCDTNLQEVHYRGSFESWLAKDKGEWEDTPMRYSGIRVYFDGEVVNEINIADGETRIEDNAYKGCAFLTKVSIPASVTSIGACAFYDCSGLTDLTIPDSVTFIGNSAFQDCSGLINLKIPDGVTSIERQTFAGCESLLSITIPDGVTSIGGAAFYGCESLESIIIPVGVKSIGGVAFYNCKALQEITIPNSVTSIEERAFASCTNLRKAVVPEALKEQIRSRRVFEDCSMALEIEYV